MEGGRGRGRSPPGGRDGARRGQAPFRASRPRERPPRRRYRPPIPPATLRLSLNFPLFLAYFHVRQRERWRKRLVSPPLPRIPAPPRPLPAAHTSPAAPWMKRSGRERDAVCPTRVSVYHPSALPRLRSCRSFTREGCQYIPSPPTSDRVSAWTASCRMLGWDRGALRHLELLRAGCVKLSIS